jgi:GNAT superfamily N-acetyltransferase
MKLLKAFFDSKLRNQWLNYKLMDVFVRKGIHFHPITKVRLNCFDMANVVVREHSRGKGIFSTWFAEAIELAREYDFDAVYVENVINDQFVEHFRKSEMYVECGNNMIPCFFILLKEPHDRTEA